MITIQAAPLSADAFAPFGEVIEPGAREALSINAARFERFDGLANIDCHGATVNVGLMRCVRTSAPPCDIELLERHPKGSQAFLPLDERPYLIGVAPATTTPDAQALRAFVVPARTGINMRAGIWHIPLLGSALGQTFAVIDRAGDDNCDEFTLPTPIRIEASL
ncbi:MAG: ureidoglycolate lyase [Pseudomonadota bacterium]